MSLQLNNLNLILNKNGNNYTIIEELNLLLNKSEIVGLVGESGCGKTSVAFSIMDFFRNKKNTTLRGEVLLHGKDILKMSNKELSSIRGNNISYIFQEPFLYMNPSLTIGSQLCEVLQIHKKISLKEAWLKSIELLKQLMVPFPEFKMKSYPFELSGGQLQRIMIAMAILCEPDFLIADEPTTALDVSTQKQVLEILLNLKEKKQLGILLISHDLAMVSQIADRIVVMYASKIVETGKTADVLQNPKHPYTKALLESMNYGLSWEKIPTIKGDIPDLFDKPSGCYFHKRCQKAEEKCLTSYPEMTSLDNQHMVSCFYI